MYQIGDGKKGDKAVDKPASGGGTIQEIEDWLKAPSVVSASVPNYGLVLGGVGLLGLTWYGVRKGFFARLFG